MGSLASLKINLILVELFLLTVIIFFVLMTSYTIVDKVFAGLLASVSLLNSLGIVLGNPILMKRIYNLRLFMLLMFILYFGVIIATLAKKPFDGIMTDLKELGDELIKAGLVCIMFTFWIGMNKQLIRKLLIHQVPKRELIREPEPTEVTDGSRVESMAESSAPPSPIPDKTLCEICKS